MSSNFDYNAAQAAVSDTDKKRILALFLTSDQSVFNWEKAAQAYGTGTTKTFRNRSQEMMQKIKNAGNHVVASPSSSASSSPSGIKKSKPKGKGKAKPTPIREAKSGDGSESELNLSDFKEQDK